MPTGVASGLPAGWEWDYDGTRWFYTFKANGHVQYHFPSEGDEFPDFVGVTEPAPGLEPEGRLESHQQVRRVTGAAAPSERRKRNKKKENGMTATAPRPVGIEWDGDIGGSSEEEQEPPVGGGRTVFEPENLMFLGPQAYTDVSPLNEEEEEAAKRTVVGAVVVGDGRLGGVSPAETTSAGTPATKRAEPVTEGAQSQAAQVIVSEIVEAQVVSMPPAKEEPTPFREEEAPPVRDTNKAEGPAHALAHAAPQKTAPEQETRAAAEPAPSPPPAQQSAPVAAAGTEATAPPPPQHHEATASPPPQAPTPAAAEPLVEPRYELPVPDSPFNPVGVIAEMPTEDTPRSHIELNPIPVEIMDASVLAPIETAAAAAAATPPPPGVVELPGQSSAAAVVRQTPPPQQQQRSVAPPVMMRMKIKRKPTDPNAAIPSPLSAGSSSYSPAAASAAVSPPSVASPSPAVPTPPPAPAAALMSPQYKPYAPVSPLLRADMEPVRASPPPMQQQSATTVAPPSPMANPQLSYAPSVLCPAGRKSTNVSPERRQEAGSQAPAGGVVQNGMPEKAVPQQAPVPPGQMLQPGEAPPPRPSQQHVQALRPGHIPAQGQMEPPASVPQQGPAQVPPHGQAPVPGSLPSYLQPPQRQLPQQGQGAPQVPVSTHAQTMQSASRPPMQHGRPMSMAAAPGQYPPVPIPQPYGQYQRLSPQIGQHPGPSWIAPGQQVPNQQAPGQNFAAHPPQQQPPPGWMRQSMPPGHPQLPPNGRHSMMGPTVPGPVPLESQYRPTPPPKSPLPNQQPVGQGPHTSSTTDSPVVSPLRSRADSQPSGISLPSPSPIETPQVQPAAPPRPQQKQPKPGNIKVGTGGSAAAEKRMTTGSYFPPSKDHPVGLVGNIADQFAAEMQALLGSQAKPSGPEPTATTAMVKPEPKTLVGAPSPSSGHVLGRIEEHEVIPNPAPARSSTNTMSAEPAPATNTAQPQPPAPAISQQSTSNSPPKTSQEVAPPLGGQPGVPLQNAQTRIPSASQAVPPAPLRPQASMPPLGAPQQQWQGKLQQPMQRPPSVPPQMQMQPNMGKENKWTKWFKSSKPEKRPDAPQGGMPQQQQPPQQPQQWQPGPPVPGHPVQRLSMQGPPMQGSIPGYPVQGQPAQRQSIQGQPLQRPPMGGHMPPQTAPIKAYSPYQMPQGAAQGPIPQTVAQQGPSGSYPPQQYLPLQSGQPGVPYGALMQQMYGRPVMQMQSLDAPGSPAPSQTAPSQFSNSPSQASIASLPPTGPPQPHPQIASPMQSNLMPAPLSLRPKSGVPVGVPASGQPS